MVTLYSMPGSPACRSVLMTAKAIGLDLKIVEVNTLAGETKTPEYLKLNPQHTVPTLVDNDLSIAESRAIMEYICDAYGKNDDVYPKDVVLRAQVHARLFFDATTLYPKAATAYFAPLFSGGERKDSHFTALDDALEVLDNLLNGNLYLVGDRLTIADITCAETICNIEACGHDLTRFKNIPRWLENCEKVIPGFQEFNKTSLEWLKNFQKEKLGEK